jgi:antitoxin ParD1/3/4
MATIEKISIALPSDMLAMVRAAVDKGDYASTSEVVREALRQWKARRALQVDAVGELRRLWEEGLQSGASEPLDIAATKRRARARLAGKRSST